MQFFSLYTETNMLNKILKCEIQLKNFPLR